MNHALILPILLPLLSGCLLLLFSRTLGFNGQRGLSLGATLALPVLALWLLSLAQQGPVQVYALGNWPAPFGIQLLLDRLSALLLLAVSVLACAALLYAIRGDDKRGLNFHALFQFQLAGLNGAFLTGDLFNLFVFFEILLIASYALLLHGLEATRVRAGLHYVLLNLTGSALFLIALGLLYGIAGTLNMADLARKVAHADAQQAPILAAAGLLLLVVFGLKAALVPLHFWLPRTYAAACAPVAALFAIMTKVGIYAIIRVFTLIFGAEAGLLANLVQPWLWPLALLTVLAGTVSALAARDAQTLVAGLVVVSAGTLLSGVALHNAQALSAALYYLLHSTWVAGGLFLLVDVVARQRGSKGARLENGAALLQPSLLAGLFFFGAISVAGLPPLPGFFAKLMLLNSVTATAQAFWLWPVLLLSSLGALIALSRAGSALFWRAGRLPAHDAVRDDVRLTAAAALLLLGAVLVLLAHPLMTYVQATAAQLLDASAYQAALPPEVQK
ncbi:MAG: monovalent cation/H+ antiporter subunit D [Pseudomonas sp.]